MADWVLAAERAYVAAAVAGAAGVRTVAAGAAASTEAAGADPVPASAGASPGAPLLAEAARSADHQAYAIAAAGAVASRFLAVGTPRSFGIVIDDAGDAADAALSLVAHRTWFAPRDIRCAALAGGADELAAATSGRVVSVAEALACDIAIVHARRARIAPHQLRRGTHVNAVAAEVLDPELAALATVVHDADLPALAAGLVDGRQLDELTIFVTGAAPIARGAIDAVLGPPDGTAPRAR